MGRRNGLAQRPPQRNQLCPEGRNARSASTGRRFGCSMISAITNRGELSFMVFEGTFKNATFIEFMKRLIREATRKIYLIVDGHPVHR
ncbi:transposase [Burkholderia ubonensis]|uniref:transposase n=1 Tax=Burkholderia ubonensis TaxID=101571 RepID=UPI0009B396AC|nr:transposase [Burkholderia ubonensis]